MSDKETRQETKTQRTDGTWFWEIDALTQSIALFLSKLFLWLKTDEEQEKAPWTATLMYWWYMSCWTRGFAEVIRRFVP